MDGAPLHDGWSAFGRWMKHLDLDPSTPNLVGPMNYLAYGNTSNKWSFNTVKAYKTAIFALYNDTAAFSSYAPFEELMTAMARKGVKRIRHAEVNLDPIFDFLNKLKSNGSMHLLELTQKMCWLLAVCGFLRPDDIACIDLSESRMADNKLELSILLPKELRQQQRIRKTVVVLPHTDPRYCPVAAFQEYYRRIAHVLVPVPHYKDPQQVFIPLVRNVRDLQQAVSVDRINNHLKHYLEMIPRPPGAPRLKARAIGATRALMKGVSVEDVMVQGNWSSPAIVDSFYRMSRQTANNFTTA
ncbi:hypothetical protein EDD11_006811, partial [Mortierella claussenii]